MPVDEVLNDILRAFHHPALRDERIEIHRDMFNTVRRWVDELPNRGSINHVLSSASVKAGHNHKGGDKDRDTHSHGALFGGHGKTSGSIWSEIQARDLDSMEGRDGNPQNAYQSSEPQLSGSSTVPPRSPKYGYESGAYRPETTGGPDSYPDSYSAPNQYAGAPPYGYQQPPYQQGYGGYQGYGYPNQNSYQQSVPYPEQPAYGGPAQYQSGYNQGPAPPGPGGYQQGPPYPGDYQPRPPYGGGGYGY